MTEIELTIQEKVVPYAIAEFLHEADRRVEKFVQNNKIRGFVPCDFVTNFHALQAIVDSNLACGDAFCEWGSGFGVIASLAAMLGFDACGFEIDRGLFDQSKGLASDFDIAVDFINGSFIPQGAESLVDHAFAENEGQFLLDTQADRAYEELGLEICDFDVIFNYPWPDDQQLTESLFENYAADGALLLTYHELNGVRLRRK